MNQDATPNPYEIPSAALAQSQERRPLRVPAMNGLSWLSSAWEIFKQRPGLFIGMTLLLLIINVALALLPVIGQLASPLLTPVLMAGFAFVACKVDRGQDTDVGDLFAGFRINFSSLLIVGAIFLGLSLALMMVGALAVGVGIAIGLDPSSGLSPVMLLAVFMTIVLAMLLIMMVMFTVSYAAVMVMLGNYQPGEAYQLAFNAFMVNFMPFLVYGLVSMVLYIFGALPLLLGLLVVSPLTTIAIYTGVKDMFPAAIESAVTTG